ncbi:hypothetical protein AADG00_000945 [Klebsiella pneumoniae]|uniref:hypothetical protein n=1 Tax=Klebsiella pneumoniae TaxID=573 RepID=UPI0027F5C401|nr:hypothetical protein [Klebsiella pneumoniae]ELA2911534.1 hypothetical protein [Klebsiella pneumoniae]
MQDLFFETVAFQRIALVAKLMATADCSEEEKDLALAWLSEMTMALGKRLDEHEKNTPVTGAIHAAGAAFSKSSAICF